MAQGFTPEPEKKPASVTETETETETETDPVRRLNRASASGRLGDRDPAGLRMPAPPRAFCWRMAGLELEAGRNDPSLESRMAA